MVQFRPMYVSTRMVLRAVARSYFLIVMMVCVSAVTASASASRPKVADVPDGSISGNVYSNEALGIKLHIPDGWTANVDGEVPSGLDFHPDKRPERPCVTVLVSFGMASPAHRDYRSTGSLFLLDPACFPDAKFPQALDRVQFRDFAGKMIHAFAKSPYIAPDGADIGDLQNGRFIFVILTGNDNLTLADGSTLHENRLFELVEFNGYWVCWGARADDERVAQLKNLSDGLKFWVGPKGTMPEDH